MWTTEVNKTFSQDVWWAFRSTIELRCQLMSLVLGPVSESRFSENSEFVNPEIRETLGFLFQKER